MAKKKSPAKAAKPASLPIRHSAPARKPRQGVYANTVEWLDCVFTPVIDLFARYYMALVFLRGGAVRLQALIDGTWAKTANVYAYNFPGPSVSAKCATILGVGGEVILPIMLLFGFGGRIAAFGLLIMTLFMVGGPEGYPVHQLWAIILAFLLARGPGVLSLDYAFKYESCGMCKK